MVNMPHTINVVPKITAKRRFDIDGSPHSAICNAMSSKRTFGLLVLGLFPGATFTR